MGNSCQSLGSTSDKNNNNVSIIVVPAECTILSVSKDRQPTYPTHISTATVMSATLQSSPSRSAKTARATPSADKLENSLSSNAAISVELCELRRAQNTPVHSPVLTNSFITTDVFFHVGSGFMEERKVQSPRGATTRTLASRNDQIEKNSDHNICSKFATDQIMKCEKDKSPVDEEKHHDCLITNVVHSANVIDTDNDADNNDRFGYNYEDGSVTHNDCKHVGSVYREASTNAIGIASKQIVGGDANTSRQAQKKARHVFNTQQSKRRRQRRHHSTSNSSNSNGSSSKSLRNYKNEGYTTPSIYHSSFDAVCTLVPFTNKAEEINIDVESPGGARTALALLMANNTRVVAAESEQRAVRSQRNITLFQEPLKTQHRLRVSRNMSARAGFVQAGIPKTSTSGIVMNAKPY